MLWTIFVVLLILWGLGLITGYTMGGVIHALLVIAIVVILIQFIQGRRRAQPFLKVNKQHLKGDNPCRSFN